MPDGTTQTVQLTATTTSPPPTGSFTIGSYAGRDGREPEHGVDVIDQHGGQYDAGGGVGDRGRRQFFQYRQHRDGHCRQQSSHGAGAGQRLDAVVRRHRTDSLAPGFAAGDTITVNGTTISFNTTGTTGSATAGTLSIDIATSSISDVLSAIDTISGTTTPSTVSSGGVVTLNDNAGSSLSVTSSDPATLAALGFSGPVSLAAPTTTPGTASTSGTVIDSQTTAPLPINGATALSGGAGTNSLTPSFGNGDTLTVNGKTITFSTSAATSTNANGGVINLSTGSIQDVLSAIDQITGTSTPSTVSGGVIALHTDNAAGLNITSSNAGAFNALGFSGTVSAVQPPLRVGPGSAADDAGQRRVQHGGLVHRQFGAGFGACLIDGAHRFLGDSAIRRPGQRTGDPLAVAERSRYSPPSRHRRPEPIPPRRSRPEPEHRDQPDAAAGQQSIADIQSDFANAQTRCRPRAPGRPRPRP